MKLNLKNHYNLAIISFALLIIFLLPSLVGCNKTPSTSATAEVISEKDAQTSKNVENDTESKESLDTGNLSEAEKAKIELDKELMNDTSQTSGETSSSLIATGDSILPDGKTDLLVISPGQFIANLVVLKEHKNNTGLSCKLVTLEDLYENYEGKDEAEKIKYCLSDYYTKSNLKYALLVGDSDKFPVRYTKIEFDSKNTFNTVFVPSDFYFADLLKEDGSFDDWDSNKNGYFGELRGDITSGPINIDDVDLTPEIAIGRFPASTPAEVANCVKKVIAYEKGAYNSTWAKTALLIAQAKDWITGICSIQENMASGYLTDWSALKLYSGIDTNAELSEKEKLDKQMIGEDMVDPSASCEKTDPLNPENINKFMNQGVGLVGYLGHGFATAWYECYDISDIEDLNNADTPPIILSMGCSNAIFTPSIPFNPYTDTNGASHAGIYGGEIFNALPVQPSCIQAETDIDGFGETFLTSSESGSSSFMGFVILGAADNLSCMYEPFFKAISEDENILGELFNYSIEYYCKNRISTLPEVITTPGEGYINTFQQPWAFILFGDPSLRIEGVKP